MTFENGYAVVIGVDENQLAGLELPTVAKDVKALHEVLIHPERCAYDPENVKLLHGAESTKNNILEALWWLKEKVEKDPGATAVFYYSGHGYVDEEDNQYYLIPYDIKSLEKLKLYALKAEDFTSELEDITPERMLIILDCCHSGGMGAKNVDLASLVQKKKVHPASFPINLPGAKSIPESKGGLESKAISDLKKGNGRAVLNSSTGSQLSWTRADGQMSLFTYHLIQALTGHAPHPDDAKVVLVTDVMSWVTFEVEKSAAAIQKDQTPVMQTTGVFPVAQLIGGQGVALSKGFSAPDPLAPLPKASNTTTFHQEGQSVEKQYNLGNVEGGIGHLGDNINNYGDNIKGNKIETGSGDYIEGDKVGGDKFTGDKVGGNKFEGITISGVSGGAISLTGDAVVGSQVKGSQLGGGSNINVLFAPLHQLVAQQNPGLSGKVNALKEQVALGSGAADDKTMAGLVQDLADSLPAIKPELARLFTNSAAANAIGPRTEFVLERLG
jgi:hypothetical protein